jgi:hypothetical protein
MFARFKVYVFVQSFYSVHQCTLHYVWSRMGSTAYRSIFLRPCILNEKCTTWCRQQLYRAYVVCSARRAPILYLFSYFSFSANMKYIFPHDLPGQVREGGDKGNVLFCLCKICGHSRSIQFEQTRMRFTRPLSTSQRSLLVGVWLK